MNAIVYHIFCVGNYLDVVNKQTKRLIDSGLYDFVDCLEVTCVDPTGKFVGIDEVFSNLKKANIFKTTKNRYEWWGINKCWELSQNNDGLIFYFHAKGVSNNYIKHGEQQISDSKTNGIKGWTEILEYLCIDKWVSCVEALQKHNNCGVTCINGWWWGNFWWSTMKWIRDNQPPARGDRWYFEAWLNHARIPKIKEFFHFTYNPYFCILPDDLYKTTNWFENKNIEIISAEYGTSGVQVNESDVYAEKITVDVTSKVKKYFEENNKKQIKIYASNDLEGDPAFKHKKYLFVKLKADDQLLQFCVNEGMCFDISL